MSSVCLRFALGVIITAGFVSVSRGLPLQPTPLPTLPPRRYLEPSFDKDAHPLDFQDVQKRPFVQSPLENAKLPPRRPPPPPSPGENNFYGSNAFKDQETRSSQVESNNIQSEILDPYKKGYFSNYEYEGYFPKEDDGSSLQMKNKDQDTSQDYTDQFKKVYYANTFTHDYDNYLTQVDTNNVQQDFTQNGYTNNNIDYDGYKNEENNIVEEDQNKYAPTISQSYNGDKPLVNQYQLNSPQAVNYPVDQTLMNQYLQNPQARKIESVDKPVINLYPQNPLQPINYSVDKSLVNQYQQNSLTINHPKDQTTNQYMQNVPQTLTHPIEQPVVNQYLQTTPQSMTHNKDPTPINQYLPNPQTNHVKEQSPVNIQNPQQPLNHPTDQPAVNQYLQPHSTQNVAHSKDQALVNQYLPNSYQPLNHPVDSPVAVPQYLQNGQQSVSHSLDQPMVNQYLPQTMNHPKDQVIHQTEKNQYQNPDHLLYNKENNIESEVESDNQEELQDNTNFVEDKLDIKSESSLPIPITESRGVSNFNSLSGIQNLQPFKQIVPNQFLGALANGMFVSGDISESEIKARGWDPRFFPSKQGLSFKMPQPSPSTQPFWTASHLIPESANEIEEIELDIEEDTVEDEDENEDGDITAAESSEREIFSRTTTITKTTTWYLNHNNEIVVEEEVNVEPQILKGKYQKIMKTTTSGPIPWYLKEFEDILFQEENEQSINILDKITNLKGMTATSISSLSSKPNSWSSEVHEEVAFEGIAFEEDGVDSDHKLHYSGPHQLPCGHIVELQLINPEALKYSQNLTYTESDEANTVSEETVEESVDSTPVVEERILHQSEYEIPLSVPLQTTMEMPFEETTDIHLFKENRVSIDMIGMNLPYTTTTPKPANVPTGLPLIENSFSPHPTIPPSQFQDPTHSQQPNFKGPQPLPQFGNLLQQGNRRDLQLKPEGGIGLHPDNKWQMYQNIQPFPPRQPRGRDL